jgi:hypothetical protein
MVEEEEKKKTRKKRIIVTLRVHFGWRCGNIS